MCRLQVVFSLSLIYYSIQEQFQMIELSSFILDRNDLFSKCQHNHSNSDALFKSMFDVSEPVFQLYSIFNETIKNKSICEIPIVENSKLYSDAILNKVQIEHRVGTLKLWEPIGNFVNQTYYLRTHYHFYIFIDTDEKIVKDIKTEPSQDDYVQIDSENLQITYTIEYIDIVDLVSEPYAYVGFILSREIKYFICFSFVFLGSLLSIVGTILLGNKHGIQKDNDDEESFVEGNGSLINFELFLTYEELVVGISIISNGVQLIQFIILLSLFYTFTDFNFLDQNYQSSIFMMYLSCSIWNGASVWWTLVQLRRTLYRKSKLLWQSCKAALLVILLFMNNKYPVLILLLNKSFFPLIVIEIMQAVGIIFGMAIGASFIHDGFGEHKQLFYSDSQNQHKLYPDLKMIKLSFIYGLVPYLSIHVLITEQIYQWLGKLVFSIDITYILLIIAYSMIIFSITLFATLSETGYCKTTWSKKSIEIATAPLIWLVLYQIIFYVNQYDHTKSTYQFVSFCLIINLALFYITGAISMISSIAIQKHLQSCTKLE